MQPAQPRRWLDPHEREQVLGLLTDAARTCAAARGLRQHAEAARALLRRVGRQRSRAPEPREVSSDRPRARAPRSSRESDRAPVRRLQPPGAGRAPAAIDRTG